MERDTVYLGMDVHKDLIALAAYVEEPREPRDVRLCENVAVELALHNI